jgi:hypothetical protein
MISEAQSSAEAELLAIVRGQGVESFALTVHVFQGTWAVTKTAARLTRVGSGQDFTAAWHGLENGAEPPAA